MKPVSFTIYSMNMCNQQKNSRKNSLFFFFFIYSFYYSNPLIYHFYFSSFILWIQVTICNHFLSSILTCKHHLCAVTCKYITFLHDTHSTKHYIHIILFNYFLNQFRRRKTKTLMPYFVVT